MELHKSRAGAILSLVLAAGCLLCAPRSTILAALGFIAFTAIAVSLVRPIRFRFRISPEGLDLRVHGIRRPVPWTEIDALVLEQPPRQARTNQPPAPRLLLVPVAGSDLGDRLTEVSPVDQRPARLLLACDEVKETPNAIAEGLRLLSGGRFTDARGPGVDPAFLYGLRGYEPAGVDALVRQAELALASGDPVRRGQARQQIEDTALTVALRGYERAQVDEHLAHLSERLSRD